MFAADKQTDLMFNNLFSSLLKVEVITVASAVKQRAYLIIAFQRHIDENGSTCRIQPQTSLTFALKYLEYIVLLITWC